MPGSIPGLDPGTGMTAAHAPRSAAAHVATSIDGGGRNPLSLLFPPPRLALLPVRRREAALGKLLPLRAREG